MNDSGKDGKDGKDDGGDGGDGGDKNFDWLGSPDSDAMYDQNRFNLNKDDNAMKELKKEAVLIMGSNYATDFSNFLTFFNTRMILSNLFSNEDGEEDSVEIEKHVDKIICSWKEMIQVKVGKRVSETSKLVEGAYGFGETATNAYEKEACGIIDETIETVAKYVRCQLIDSDHKGESFIEFLSSEKRD